MIPAHEKDYGVLPDCLRSVLRHVSPIRRVLVVATRPFEYPDDRVSWVSEPTDLPALGDVRNRLAAGSSRASWLYQQVLKLGADLFVADLTASYLVIDSDVIFLRPVSFDPETEGRFPYSRALEFHLPYREAYERLFGKPPNAGFSLTAHHMLFDRAWLGEMRSEIEKLHAKPWHDAFVDAAGKDSHSPISEWNVYGWWVLDHYPEESQHRQLQWGDVRGAPGLVQRAALAAHFDYVAAHAWAREPRPRRYVTGAARIAAEVKAVLQRRFAG
jgi:hypothetical protein